MVDQRARPSAGARGGDAWKIYAGVTDGASRVDPYRGELKGHLVKGGCERLLEVLKAMVAQQLIKRTAR